MKPLFISAFLAVFALVITMVIPGADSTAQNPPLPTTRYLSSFAGSKVPADYELVHQILDFAPGAVSREHSHGGDAFVTVLEGQSGRREAGLETIFAPGQTYLEPQGVIHSVRAVDGRLRVYVSFLLPPGAPQTINVPDAPIPATLPTTPFISRIPVGNQLTAFNLTQAVLDFGPGAVLPMHTQGGPGLAMVIAGEVAFRTGVTEVRVTEGGTFAELAEAHEARNVGAGPATLVITSLIPSGAAFTSFVPPPRSVVTSSPPPISPPRTGDAGLADIPGGDLSSWGFLGVLSVVAVVAAAAQGMNRLRR